MTPRRPLPTRRGPGRPAGDGGGARRDALLEAAGELMAERGLPRVTIREVAERAGVQPALVHYYFDGKEGLLRAAGERVAARMLAQSQAALAREGSAEERLSALLHAIVEVLGQHPYGPRLVMEQVLFGRDDVIDDFVERFASRNLALAKGVLEQGRSEGSFREVDLQLLLPQLVGSCLFFYLAAPLMKRLFGVERIDAPLAEHFADHVAETLLNGIRVRPEPSP